MYSILFVDDEKAILRSLKRMFNGTGWELYFAEDGAEALKILSEHHVDLVVSDMRMPRMDGHKLLSEVQRIYPHTIRIILSGFSDEKEIYKAVLDGSAKNYLFKPWEQKELLGFVNSIFRLYAELNSKKILNSVNQARRLPTFKRSIRQLNALFEQDAGMAEIAAIIEEDPGIAARLLQLVNSSSYDKKVGSARQAVFQIGKQSIKSIINDKDSFLDLDWTSEEGAKAKSVLQHSVLTKHVMQLTYESFLNKPLPDVAVTAGLLHDIGRIYEEQAPVPHEELGGHILQWWGIPMEIVECALFHHTPFLASPELFELVGSLYLANHYANTLLRNETEIPNADVFFRLGINPARYEEFMRSALATWHIEQWD